MDYLLRQAELNVRRIVNRARLVLGVDAIAVVFRPVGERWVPKGLSRKCVVVARGLEPAARLSFDSLVEAWGASTDEAAGVLATAHPRFSASVDQLASKVGYSSVRVMKLGDEVTHVGLLVLARKGQRATVAEDDERLVVIMSEAIEWAITGGLVLCRLNASRDSIIALMEQTKEMIAVDDCHELPHAIVHGAEVMTKAGDGFLVWRDETDDKLFNIRYPRARDRPIEGISWEVPYGNGIVGKIAATQRPVLFDSRPEYASELAPAERLLLERGKAESLLCVPAVAGSSVIGAICVHDPSPGKFCLRDQHVLEPFADNAGVAMARAHALRSLRKEVAAHEKLTVASWRGGDEQAIAEAAYELLGKPVGIYDSSHHLVGYAPTDLDDALKSELTSFGRFAEAIRSNGDLWSAVGERVSFVQSVPESRLTRPRLVARAPSGEEVLGYVHVLGDKGVFLDEDVRVAEKVALVLALLLTAKRSEAQIEERIRADLLDSLVRGGQQSVVMAAKRALHLGLDLESWHVVGVAVPGEFEAPSGDEAAEIGWGRRLHRGIRVALDKFGSGVLCDTIDERVVFLAPCPSPGSDFEVFVGELGLSLNRSMKFHTAGMPVLIGLGTPEDRVELFASSYEKAMVCCNLMRHAPCVPSGCRVLSYSSLGHLTLFLDSIGSGRLDDFVTASLGHLADYDREHRAELVATLECYLESACNKAKTAEALGLHLNGLKYRLERIEAIAGVDLCDPDARFNMALAVRILRTQQRVGAG